MSRSPTRLGSPAFGWIASGRLPAAGTICSSTPHKVLEPTEQFAPRAWTPSARNVRPTSAGERPVNVTPSSVKAIGATMGRSVTERIASIASAISARSENVSTMHASTPPSRSPSACSRNAARASSAVTLPSGARYLPSGPTDPMIKTSRPVDSRTSRASRTPRRLTSRTWLSSPCVASLKRLAPKVFVSIRSAPAATYSAWIACTSLGLFRLRTSKQASSDTPRAWSIVPIAPSQRSGPASRRRLNACGMRFPERGQHARDDLVRAEPARVDHDVRAPIVGLARAVECLQLLGGPAREHRPVCRPARSLVEVGEVAGEPHDGAERPEGLHAPLAARETAARRDHVARLQLEGVQRVGFELAEPLLALHAEDLGDRAPHASDDHVVSLHEAAPEPPRQQSADRRLPGAHEADENDVIRSHPPHRIRSCLRGC